MRSSTPIAVRRPASPLRIAAVSSAVRSKPRSAVAGSLESWRRNAPSLMARWTTFAIASFDIWTLPKSIAPWSWREIAPAGQCPRPPRSRAVCDPRDRTPLPPPALLQLRQVNRFASWFAHPAVERVVDDKRAQRRVLVAAEHVEEERMRFRVLTAGATAAETAGPQRRSLAHPAVHSPLRSPDRGPETGGTDIMRRPVLKFAHRLARGAHQPGELVPAEGGKRQVREGGDGRGSRPAVQQRYLPEAGPRPDSADRCPADGHLGLALPDDVVAVPGIAFAEDGLSGRDPHGDDVHEQPLKLDRIETFE